MRSPRVVRGLNDTELYSPEARVSMRAAPHRIAAAHTRRIAPDRRRAPRATMHSSLALFANANRGKNIFEIFFKKS